MKRLADLATGCYADLPRIDRQDVRLLWHSDFWDVPLSGLVLYRGKKYWFQTARDTPPDATDKIVYVLVELSAQQLQIEEHWHALFRQKVGPHTDYDEQGHRDDGVLKSRRLRAQFYRSYGRRGPRDFANNPVVGWWRS